MSEGLEITQKLLHDQLLCPVLLSQQENLNVMLWNLQHETEESYKNGGLNIKGKKWKLADESKTESKANPLMYKWSEKQTSHINYSVIAETIVLLISPDKMPSFCKPTVWLQRPTVTVCTDTSCLVISLILKTDAVINIV